MRKILKPYIYFIYIKRGMTLPVFIVKNILAHTRGRSTHENRILFTDDTAEITVHEGKALVIINLSNKL